MSKGQLDYLPASLKEMIPEIGIEGVRRLVQKCGGMAFKHLPPEPTPEHLLTRLVGLDLAREVCRIHARCDLYIVPERKPQNNAKNSTHKNP